MPKATASTSVITSLEDLKGIVRFEGDGLQKQISDITGLDCSAEPSLTKQEFAKDADINEIMARYVRTGVTTLRSDFQSGKFADLASMPDYVDACQIVIDANAAFAALDANIRKNFDNDPAKFLAFVNDPKNVDRFKEFGLLDPIPEGQAAHAAAVAAEGVPEGGSPSGNPPTGS